MNRKVKGGVPAKGGAPALGVLLLALLLLAVGCGGGKSSSKGVLNFTLKNLDGDNVQLNKFQGKVVILDVWDTWCPPCRKGIPELVQLYGQYRNRGLEVVGIALAQRGLNEVKQFVNDNNVTYTTLIAEPVIYDIFGKIGAIPTTFVIDTKGRILKKHVGYTAKDVFELEIKDILPD
jgi:cytochrome c biogenesis protein CcmG/thiol:disulfide interchange protein DsbE